MSRTFSIACMPAKVYLTVGQGANISEEMRRLWLTDEQVGRLVKFMNTYINQELRFFCNDTNEFHLEDDWRDFEEI